MPAVLVIQVAGQRRSAVLRGPTIIGRGETCTLRIETRKASRQHVLIEERHGQWIVQDLGSRNGTWVNAQRLEGARPLRSRDRVWIGDAVAAFVILPSVAPVHETQRRGGMGEGDVFFRCGACRQKVLAPFYLVASVIRCPRCRVRLVVPMPADGAPVSGDATAAILPAEPVDISTAELPPDSPPIASGVDVLLAPVVEQESEPPAPAHMALSGVFDRASLANFDQALGHQAASAPSLESHSRAGPHTHGGAAGAVAPPPQALRVAAYVGPLSARQGDAPAPVAWSQANAATAESSAAMQPHIAATSDAPHSAAITHLTGTDAAFLAASIAAHATADSATLASTAIAMAAAAHVSAGAATQDSASPESHSDLLALETGEQPASETVSAAGIATTHDDLVTTLAGSSLSGSGLFDLVRPPVVGPAVSPAAPTGKPGAAPRARPGAAPPPSATHDPEREIKLQGGLRERAGGIWASLAARSAASHGRTRAILAQSKSFASLSDDDVRAQLAALHLAYRQRRQQRSDDDIALALACEAMRRTPDGAPPATQVAAALAMNTGCFAILPGDASIALALAAVLAGLRGRGCHVILTEPGAAIAQVERLRPFYRRCGQTIGCAHPGLAPRERRNAYHADVTYVTCTAALADHFQQHMAAPQGARPAGPRPITRAPSTNATIPNAAAPGIAPATPPQPTLMRGLEFALVEDAASTLRAQITLPGAGHQPVPATTHRVALFLRLYQRLCGVTAPDPTSAQDLWSVYQVPVVPIVTRVRD